jgi:hypothetical protein
MSGTVIFAKFGTKAARITWNRALPRGNTFPVCVRPDRYLQSDERTEILTFCDAQFGNGNWFLSPSDDMIAFRNNEQLTTFMEQF